MALNLLHECNYNYIKAKFYILFPYYKTYNKLRCHQPLILSDQQMEHKINVHIENLKSSKQNDLMKWVKTIQNQMQSRIHISKINTYLQIAKQNKYDIPENIKDIIQKSAKFGKQLKKNILNSKNKLQKLQSIKNQLLEHKIVTNEMIHFQQALARSQEWIKKQIKFQEQYYIIEQNQNPDLCLKLKNKQYFKQYGKIQYRLLQNIVNQYNSLPLYYPSYINTTLNLYDQTNKIISQIPSLTKAAKTRKSDQSNGVIKLPRKMINQILYVINTIPVQHQDFISFQYTITDGLEQLQRISMFLQDTKFEKNIKNLNIYQKLLSDIPIQNDVQKKLNEKIQYYQLIDRIKKDISNPSKYDSLKDQLMKLKQRGYQNQQHAKLQSRVMACMGWHQSQQLIKQEKKIPNRIFIILNQKYLKSKIIKFQNFQSQLLIARHQLNISEDILKQSQCRLQEINILKEKILNLFDQQQPQLNDLLDTFNKCYQNGISFFQFEQLYNKIVSILIILAKMHYLLNTSQYEKHQNFYFTNSQCQKVIDFICENKNQIRDLRTKQTGDQIIVTVNNMNFPRSLPEWKQFQQFMKKAQQWSDKALRIIEDFKNNDNMYNTKDIIQQSKSCLHSKLIQEELNKIEIALKWRQKISRKMSEDNSVIFDKKDHQFLMKLQKDLQYQQVNYCTQQQMKQRALKYMWKHQNSINLILQKISNFQIQKLIVLKLSQMNKFIKQIDRQVQKYNIKDKIINQLKQQLQIQLVVNEDWKQRYLAIKRFQKKKIGMLSNKESNMKKKQQQDYHDNDISFDLMKDQKQEENYQNYYPNGYVPKAMQIPYSPLLLSRPLQLVENIKKKYIIKNGQFCWYFRMLLLMFEFYNGCKLKFVVDQFLKLKNALTQVYRLIEKYNIITNKIDRTDLDYEYLDSQACKIPIFFRQSHLSTAKNLQITAWKNIAQPILRSVPVINMQLKARRVEQLRQLIQKKKNEQIMQQHKIIQQQTNQITNKRRRKPNQLYQNDDITLFKDQYLISKNKKRKGNNKLSNGNSNYQNIQLQYRNINTNSNINIKKLKGQRHKYNQRQRQNDRQRDNHSNRQTLQHLQQLILNSENAQLIIDDPKLYCICRNGVPNQNSLMVMCQNCQQWYHIECIGIKKHQAKNQQNYLCVGCKSLDPSYNQYNLGYYWDHFKKISEYSLIYIYKEGANLGVITTQHKKITMVYNTMLKWKQQTNNLIKKIIEDNPISLNTYQQQIYPLYLQSMWLPTVHYQSIYLKRLMKYIRDS